MNIETEYVLAKAQIEVLKSELEKITQQRDAYKGMVESVVETNKILAQKLAEAVDVEKAMRFIKDYAFEDARRIYTNGSRLVPLYRVGQAIEDRAYEESDA